ncbi:MAG: sulfurtransferase complex subunit TusC [Pseudomonadales bacterium]|nr:sulfurtransferase complex subunit TusC [Pseudomonadales bacterium]
MDKSFLFVVSHPPHGTSSARESTEALMATCAFGQQVRLLALNDGLYQFIKEQDTILLNMKDTAAMLSSLPLYGLEEISVIEEDLNARQLSPENFILPLDIIPRAAVSKLFKSADVVLSY